MLYDGSLIALDQPVAANPGPFKMRRIDGQDVAFIFSGGKPHPGVLRVGGRMWTPVHPNGPISLGDLAEHLEGDEALRVRIPLLPEPEVAAAI